LLKTETRERKGKKGKVQEGPVDEVEPKAKDVLGYYQGPL
jgi:hypothetical protein